MSVLIFKQRSFGGYALVGLTQYEIVIRLITGIAINMPLYKPRSLIDEEPVDELHRSIGSVAIVIISSDAAEFLGDDGIA